MYRAPAPTFRGVVSSRREPFRLKAYPEFLRVQLFSLVTEGSGYWKECGASYEPQSETFQRPLR